MADLKFRRLLARFERAARADEFIGGAHPDERPYIASELVAARKALVEYVEGSSK